MAKRKDTNVDDICFVAERQYQRMIGHIAEGIVDREEIVMAMDAVNIAHKLALKQNKRHLVK